MSQMAYTKIKEDTFEKLALNAGVVLSSFNPASPSVSTSDIIGSTTGGINFNATPSFIDFGEDIDNCPKNTKELMHLDDWEIKLSGTFVTADTALAKRLIALADIAQNDATKVVPRSTISASDFQDIWLVVDYSDKNTGATAGHVAIHLMNCMSTGGFQIQTADKEKGQFAFEFTAHYSLDAQDTVPFEVYVKQGTSSSDTPEITLDRHSATIAVDEELQLNTVRVIPAGSTITWSSSASGKASVTTAGLVKGLQAGSTIITASITDNGVTYSDTCTIIVAS